MALKLFLKKREKEPKRKLEKVKLPFTDEERPWYLEEYVAKVRKDYGEPLIVDKIPHEYKFKKQFNLIYPVGNGIFIHVVSDGKGSGFNKYIVVEPPRPPQNILRAIEELIAYRITDEYMGKSPEERISVLVNLVKDVVNISEVRKGKPPRFKPKLLGGRVTLSKRDFDLVIYHLIRDKVGVGVLEPFLRDPYLEDISCSGIGPIYVVHKIFGTLETSISFKDEESLNKFIITLAEKIGKPLSHARPIVDATLPDGSRINIVFGSDVSLRGSNFTIRRVSKVPLSVTQLIAWGTFDTRIAAYMWMLLSEGMSVFICGETASGKTTSLTALMVFIRPTAKIVSIEDTAEVVVPHPNWTRELTRDTGKRESSVTMFDLLKAALRQRPNYIIVGEIRGAEGNIAFQAMQSVTRDTPILIKDGETGEVRLVSIGGFVNSFYEAGEEGKPKYIEGYYTLSLNEKGRLVWAPIRYVLRHVVRDDVFRVTYEGGWVNVTGSHSVFVLDPETLEIKPKAVRELKPGDLLITPIARASDILGLRELPYDTMSNTDRYGTLGAFFGPLTSSVKIYKTRIFKLACQLAWFSRIRGYLSEVSKRNGGGYPLYYVTIDLSPKASLRLRNFRIPVGVFTKLLRNLELRKRLHELSTLVSTTLKRSSDFISKAAALELMKIIRSQVSSNEVEVLHNRLNTLVNSDVALVKVINVRRINYEGYVYDISVPGTELFFGGSTPIALHNTGHPVMSTFHAADIDRLIQRLTSHPINVPKTHMDALNVAWFQSAVYTKAGFLARRVIRIYEILGYDPSTDNILVMPVFSWDPINDRFLFSGRGSSYLLEEKIAVMRGISRKELNTIYEELDLRSRFIELMIKKKIFNYYDVWKAVVKAHHLGIEEAYKRLLRDELI